MNRWFGAGGGRDEKSQINNKDVELLCIKFGQLGLSSGGSPTPSWFLLFVFVVDFTGNPWITCESSCINYV
jgi:hypothetical protein